MELLQEYVCGNYHLHKRKEMFDDLYRLYAEKHYQSFIALGLLQLEGLFYDICSIKYDEKENAGTLVEKAEKALKCENPISYMRYYPYFAFDVPVKRNEIAHTGMIKSENMKRVANELILDLNAVARMAKMESDGKFRIFMIINETLTGSDFSNVNTVNKKLFFEFFANRAIVSDVFWEVLKKPEDYSAELSFYKNDNLPEGYTDLPTIVNLISDMVYNLPFWEEMVRVKNEYGDNKEMKLFLLKFAKNYVQVLSPDPKKKCIELLAALK